MPDETSFNFKDWIKEYTALLITSTIAILTLVGCFIYIIGYPEANHDFVKSVALMVLGFYFTSSPGSQAKDKVIAKLLNTSNEGK